MAGALALLIAALAIAVIRHSIGYLRFRHRVRVSLEATPDIRWQRWTARGLTAAVSGHVLELDLVPTYVYLRARRPPETRLQDDLADALRGRLPPVPIPPLLLVRDRILPVLKPTGALPPARGYLTENVLARRPLDGDVSIAYAVEGQFRLTYVTAGMLRAWALDEEALHALAIENLRARTRHLLEEIGGPRREYAALDGYDAARLLVGDLLVPQEIADPLFAIPHEHLLLIAPSEDEGALRAAALRPFREAMLPLTADVYRWTPAGPRRAADLPRPRV